MSYFRSPSGMQSPERRSMLQSPPRSPFCTSPSQLQEVTLDQDVSSFGYSIGIKSPTAIRGRSVKEFEEQLTNLKKENFNLKLRIYFLEERMGPNYNLDKESAVKKNIELMVDVENLKKELQEKQDLLCQALRAMELEEEEHKKETQEKEEALHKYQQQIYELEQRLQDNDIFQMDDYTSGIDLQNRIQILEEQLAKEKQNSAALEEYINKSSNVCSSNTRDLEQLLEQKEQDINHLYNELHEVTRKFTNCNQRARTLETELERCSLELQEKLNEIAMRETEIGNLTRSMQILKETLANTQELYKKEEAKSEKFKRSILLCNDKMETLQKTTDMQKLKIRCLEQKLENVQTEVKNKTQSPLQKKNTSKNTDVDSFSVPDASSVSEKGTENHTKLTSSSSPPPPYSLPSPYDENVQLEAGEHFSSTDHDTIAHELKKLKEELTIQQEKNLKLKTEQFKACQIIKKMINKREETDKEAKELRQQIELLENEIKTLKNIGEGTDASHSTKPLHEMKASDSSASALDNEKSVADATEETKILAEQYKTLSNELEKQIKLLMQTLREKDNQMEALQEQISKFQEQLKQKEHRITDLEFELLSMNNSDVNKSHVSLNSEKKDTDNEKGSTFWLQQIEEKDKEIERLESELRKRTCDLQGIVNKELWQKNREIEKLQNRFGALLENKDLEISRLAKNVASKEQQLMLLKDKICELGGQIPDDISNSNSLDEIQTLQDRLNSCQQERNYFVEQIDLLKKKLEDTRHSNLVELQTQNKYLQEELEKNEKIRVETNEVCTSLCKRLEELALFLDTLLQQKSVLGFLGWKQNGLIKQFVNQSLELSKTLSLTISQNPNQSLMEISNISALLSTTQNLSTSVAELLEQKDDNAASFALIPSDATLTYQSHLFKSNVELKDDSIIEDQNKIIRVLREQIENLKREIELRDIELNKMTLSPSKNKKNKTSEAQQSESESWSEPDRTVSLARIGLDDDSLKPNPVVTTSSNSKRNRFVTSGSIESTDDELSHTLTRTPSRKSLLAENRQTIISLHSEIYELDRKLKETELELQKTRLDLNTEQKLSAEKQHRLDELEEQIKELESKRSAAENRKHEADVLLKEAEKSLDALQVEKSELEAQLIYKDKVMLNRINELEKEKEKAVESMRTAEKIAEDAKSDMKNAEEKLNDLEQQVESIKKAVREECEEEKRIECERLNKEFESKIENIESLAKIEVEQTQTALKQLQNLILTDYVKKIELEKQTKHLEEVLKAYNEAQSTLYGTEVQLNETQHRESQLKQQIRELETQHWEKLNQLHSELDTVNLQYSEAVLEKTKLNNEKTLLEQKIKAVDAKETEVMLQAAEFRKQFDEMKEAFQKQVAVMENKKIKLEIRVSELESTNAELRNKLIVLQTSINDQVLSSSLPTSTTKLCEMYGNGVPTQQIYRRQFSDNSGYTSEEQVLEDNRQMFGVPTANEDADRQNANSSPDLGIESDHGRFSSLEANIPRPLLQTLELTESMSNLLDGDNQVQISNCNDEQCCKKTQQILSENNYLKRRLLRTRRALEETMNQLTIASQRKKQVEKTICKQIHKTSQVLRKAKANLDSGSETDVARK